MGGELDHAEHERDPGRIVDARLALQDRPRTALDLAPAEHGEHDGRISRRDRRSDDPGQDPVEAQRVVGDDGDEAGGREGAEQADREDRSRRGAEPPPADVDAAVEEDDDQCHDRDPLDGLDRHRLVHARPDVGDDCGSEQEDRRRRHRNAFSQRRRERRERETRGHDQNDGAEVVDLGHGNRRRPDFPARQPGSLRAPSHQHGRTPRVRSNAGRTLKSIGEGARSPPPPRGRIMKKVDISSPSAGIESPRA